VGTESQGSSLALYTLEKQEIFPYGLLNPTNANQEKNNAEYT